MLTTAMVLFAAAILFGLKLVSKHLKASAQALAVTAPSDRGGVLPRGAAGPNVSIDLAVFHGVFAVEGLVIVVMAFFQGVITGHATTALVLFVVAALSGFYLFTTHLWGKPLSKSAIAVHGLVAVTACILFLLAP
jgi:hypothetical protein